MDSTDPDIVFSPETGHCNHCEFHFKTEPLKIVPPDLCDERLAEVVKKIKKDGRGKQYDCIMGVSGGVDSSYVALMAKRLGLRPLAIHLDNGWNSELAVKNIYNIVKKLNIDLHTHVINWLEFRDLQRSFIKASVVDIELLTDHAITAIIYETAKKHRIKYILSGSNFATESIMPKTWYHRKSDLRNIKAIHRKYGEIPIKTFPRLSTLGIAFKTVVCGIKQVHMLNILNYNKDKAIEELTTNLDWRNYGGKHHESIFTRYYQTLILPKKFNIDKRRCHLSSLICSGQISRSEALAKLEEKCYSEQEMISDGDFVQKKLGFSKDEFDNYLSAPVVSHYMFDSDEYVFKLLNNYRAFFKKFICM